MTNEEVEQVLEARLGQLKPSELREEFRDQLIAIDWESSDAKHSVNARHCTRSTIEKWSKIQTVLCATLALCLVSVIWWSVQSAPEPYDEPVASQIEDIASSKDRNTPNLVCFNTAIRNGDDLDHLLDFQSKTLLPEFDFFKQSMAPTP